MASASASTLPASLLTIIVTVRGRMETRTREPKKPRNQRVMGLREEILAMPAIGLE